MPLLTSSYNQSSRLRARTRVPVPNPQCLGISLWRAHRVRHHPSQGEYEWTLSYDLERLLITIDLSVNKLWWYYFCSATSLDVDAVADTFWERNFDTDDEVPWFRFQQAFLTDFDSQLKSMFQFYHIMAMVIWCSIIGLFPESKIPWLLDMLKNDIFGGADNVSKNHFYQVNIFCVISMNL